MKKFVLGLICGIGLSATTAVCASDTIQAYLFPVKFVFNGQDKELDSEYTTLNYNGHAYVPIRFVAENMGALVKYEDITKTVSIVDTNSIILRDMDLNDLTSMDPEIKKMMEEPKLVHKDDQFEMKLNIQKKKYKVGEPIHYSALLTYIGDSDSILVWGPRTYIMFSLTDGKEIKMEGASTLELTATRLFKGEINEYPFFKSGGYSVNDPDAGFWKEFYSEKDLLLPAGTYLITANSNFSLTEKVVDSHYHGEVHTTIVVE